MNHVAVIKPNGRLFSNSVRYERTDRRTDDPSVRRLRQHKPTSFAQYRKNRKFTPYSICSSTKRKSMSKPPLNKNGRNDSAQQQNLASPRLAQLPGKPCQASILRQRLPPNPVTKSAGAGLPRLRLRKHVSAGAKSVDTSGHSYTFCSSRLAGTSPLFYTPTPTLCTAHSSSTFLARV